MVPSRNAGSASGVQENQAPIDPWAPPAAKDEDEVGEKVKNRHISLLGTTILPTIGIDFGYDDNLTLSNSQQIDSTFTVISPGLRVEIPGNRSFLAVSYEGELGAYHDSSLDDFDDHKFRAEYRYDPTARTGIDMYAEYRKAHDQRGTGARQGDQGLIDLEPDEYDAFGFGGRWAYGAVGAQGRIELEAGKVDLEYQNNREFTRFRDREDLFWGGTFYWRIAPKTSALVQYQWADIDYDSIGLDSEETRYLVGVTWEATAKTSGTVKFGRLDKDFDDPAREDYNGATWEAEISWSPKTYSVFTLAASRETDETDGFGDFVLREDVTLAWRHNWSDRFRTVVDIGIGDDDHRSNIRKDDLFFWGLAARWQFNRYFQLGAGVKYFERDSVQQEFDFDRYLYLISLEGSY